MTPDPHDYFTSEVEAVLRTFPSVRQVARVAGSFALDIQVEDGTAKRVFLKNYFAETRELSPEARWERLRHMLSAFASSDKPKSNWELDRQRLVPVLRRSVFGNLLRSDMPAGTTANIADGQPLRRSLLPFVNVLIALDTPTAMEFVNPSSLKSWNVSADDVYSAAFARLPALADGGVRIYDQTHGPLWIVGMDDSYETSRLLIPGWLAGFRGHVEGNPIAIIPDRSTLLIGGDARPEMIERLLTMAEREFEASTRAISCAIYTVDARGAVIPYEPNRSDELGKKIRIAHAKLALAEYGAQKEMLDQDPDTELFIATYKAILNDAGDVRSMAVWTEGVESLLPWVNTIVLNQWSEDTHRVTRSISLPFTAIQSRLTYLPGYHPPRYRSGPFPTPAEFQALAQTYDPASA